MLFVADANGTIYVFAPGRAPVSRGRSGTGPALFYGALAVIGATIRGRGNPLLTKAPLGLLASPGLLVATVGATLLLSLVVASYPLFLSAATSDILQGQIDQPLVTRYGIGVRYLNPSLLFDQRAPGSAGGGSLIDRLDEVFSARAAQSPSLGPTVESMLTQQVSVRVHTKVLRLSSGVLFAGTDAIDHVQIISGHPGSGVWLPDLIASALHVGPGDRIALTGPKGTSTMVSIDGVYRSLYAQPVSGYWRQWYSEIFPACLGCGPPPQLIIADEPEIVRLSRAIGLDRAAFSLIAPVASTSQFTLEQAQALERFVTAFRAQISAPRSTDRRLFQCCFSYAGNLTSQINDVVKETEARIGEIQGPGRLLLAAGIIVAAGVLAGCGRFMLSARRVEARLLFARGRGRGFAASKMGLETVLPCAVGAVFGLGCAFALIGLAGPSAPVAAGASRSAIEASALTLPAALLVIGGTVGWAFEDQVSRRTSRWRVLALVPWELLIAAVAWVLLRQIGASGSTQETSGLSGTRAPATLVLLLPLLLTAALSIAAGRGVAAGARGWARRSGSFPTAPYLAVHRIASRARMTTWLFAASMLSLSVFVQAQTVASSLRTTVHAKAEVFVGSDVQATVSSDTLTPRDFPLPVTKVTSLPNTGGFPSEGPSFQLLAIDPSTFASAAFWDARFSSTSLADLLAALARPRGATLPIVFVGASTTPPSLSFGGREVPITVVAHASAFPGIYSEAPGVVAAASALRRVLPDQVDPILNQVATTDLWIRGDPQVALQALGTLRFPPSATLSAQQVEDIPYIDAIIRTFLVLEVLGASAAALSIALLLTYLQARFRGQAVSYALSLLMGMRRREHARAMGIEIGVLLVAAAVAGGVIAAGLASSIVAKLDPLPSVPPAPLFQVPASAVAAGLLLPLTAALVGSWITTAAAARLDLGKVMRVAE